MILFTTFILILLLGSVKTTYGQTSFSETFDGSDLPQDWLFFGYTSDNLRSDPWKEIDHGYSIVDGALIAPDVHNGTQAHFALYPSDVVFGSWSFDWKIPKDLIASVEPAFIFKELTNKYNFTNITKSSSSLNLASYSIVMQSTPAGLTIKLWKLGQIFTNLATKIYFGSDHAGWHNIELLRNSKGLFQVSFDREVIIKSEDNEFTQNDFFQWVSWRGNSSIDNISIISEDNPSMEENSDNRFLSLNGLELGLVYLVMNLVIRRKHISG